jgi:hypothetical protein
MTITKRPTEVLLASSLLYRAGFHEEDFPNVAEGLWPMSCLKQWHANLKPTIASANIPPRSLPKVLGAISPYNLFPFPFKHETQL